MRKVSVVLVALLLVAAFAFVGCGAPAEGALSGKYVLKEAVVGGQTISAEELKKAAAGSGMESFLDMSFEFSGDKVKINALNTSADATYKVDGDKLTITEQGGSQEFTIKDGNLQMDQAGTTLVFAK